MTEKERIFVDKVCNLRSKVVPSKHRKLIDHSKADTRHGVTYTNTQYYYYKQLINDTLYQIRRGEAAYIFNLDHVAEVLRFEPKAHFDYLEDSDSIRVTL